jgi:hypothetical protein
MRNNTIHAVKDDAVLVLKAATKITIFEGPAFIEIIVPILFASICEITEFAPIPSESCDTVLNNLNQLKSIKLLGIPPTF